MHPQPSAPGNESPSPTNDNDAEGVVACEDSAIEVDCTDDASKVPCELGDEPLEQPAANRGNTAINRTRTFVRSLPEENFATCPDFPATITDSSRTSRTPVMLVDTCPFAPRLPSYGSGWQVTDRLS